MARKASTSKSSEKPKLSDHLFLCSYMHRLFGANSFDELKRRVDKVRDGYDDEGRSYIFQTLISMKGVDPRILGKLEEYDQNIRNYVVHINANRTDKVTLKYFQYIAVLYTEIFLDYYFQDPGALGEDIYDHAIKTFRDFDANYRDERDLGKLAYMMATGSGKTLIMHINLLQFDRYNTGKHKIELENILLITPNDKMSEQHLSELRLSGIPAELYNGNGGWFSGLVEKGTINVIDINKFTREKKGDEGVSVDVERFGGKNLLFVDEGHKGVTSGDAWVNYRDQLSENGFTFEYSATFSQAVAASKASESEKLLHAYGKTIIFDYSYKYFYSDGYGKDYLVMNLKKDSYDGEMKYVLMMGNLLSFYEQKRLYNNLGTALKPYQIESPLWVFVGSKVSGERQQSDIYEIIRFIDRVLRNEENWAIRTIGNILAGRSGLKDRNEREIFALSYPEHRLSYLREIKAQPTEVYRDMLSLVFHAPASAPLHLWNLRGVESEIGLKCGNNDYFGLIRISDDAGLLQLVNKKSKDIKTRDDSVSGSLFDNIDKSGSLNLLVGAKMFMEGWSSWRVSCMGLMNLGKKEGVQIIQMFGRGVRLKGKDMTLKRSSALDDTYPKNLPIVETLNVFGVEADYMEVFIDTLDVEGLATGKVTYDIPIKVNKDLLTQKLNVPDVDKSRFNNEELIRLEPTDKVSVVVDLTPIIEVLAYTAEEGISSVSGSNISKIPDELLEVVDWNSIYLKLLEYRSERRWNNMIFDPRTIKLIVKDRRYYTLKCPLQYVNPSSYTDMARLESVIITVLKKYLDKYYCYIKNVWAGKNWKISEVTPESGNFDFTYQVKVADNDVQLKEEIERQIVDNLDKIYKGSGGGPLRNIFFERHLYQPLLAFGGLDTGAVEIHPTGLKDSEQHFVRNLKAYVDGHQEELIDTRLFLLRNLPKRGTGFFEFTNYYPDFILWAIKDGKQHITFIDPKGLGRMFKGFAEEEINLKFTIMGIEKTLAAKYTRNDITLDSFIVSWTSKTDVDHNFGNGRALSLGDYLEYNVVFEEDPEHIKKILHKILADQV